MNTRNRKKILILSNSPDYTYNLRKEIIDDLLCDYHVIISSPYGKKIDYFIDRGCQFENTNFDATSKGIVQQIKLIKTYFEIVNKHKPDVILTYTIKPNLYGGMVANYFKIPFLPNITGLGRALEFPSLSQKILLILHKLIFRKVPVVFFQNEDNSMFFEKHKIAVNKHRVLPGSGVNIDKFKQLDYPQNDTIHFTYISRIMREKGIDYYLESAIYIQEKYPNTRFHVCGPSNPEYFDILKKYQNKGIIQYHGPISDVSSFLKDIHCTIHPTYYPEGMANVLLESSASARPVISTNRSGCREAIDDEKTGYIVETRNVDDLIKKIEKFVSLSWNEKKKMGIEGRKKMVREFDRKFVSEAYIEEIQKIIRKD